MSKTNLFWIFSLMTGLVAGPAAWGTGGFQTGVRRSCAAAICPYLMPRCLGGAGLDPIQCPQRYSEIYNTICNGSDLDGDGQPNNCDSDLDGDGVTDRTELFQTSSDPRSPDADDDNYCDGPAPRCLGNGGVCSGDGTDYFLCTLADDPCPEVKEIDGLTPASRYQNCQLLPETITETVTEVVLVPEPTVETVTVIATIVTFDPDLDNDGICDLASFMDNGGNLDPVTGVELCTLLGPEGDNCPFSPNPEQEDSDGDLIGDNCDTTEGAEVEGGAVAVRFGEPSQGSSAEEGGVRVIRNLDSDGDGIADNFENAIYGTDPNKADTDDDGLTDFTEIWGPTYSKGAGPLDPDLDGDSVKDGDDNCPLVANAAQENSDGDVRGNACQDDFDGDGVTDDTDNCPANRNEGQEDSDNDKVGNECDLLPAGPGQSLAQSEQEKSGGGGGCQLIRGSPRWGN